MVHPDAEKWRDGEEVYRWYTKEIASIPPPMRELLEKYSGIPAERVIPHISELVSARSFHFHTMTTPFFAKQPES